MRSYKSLLAIFLLNLFLFPQLGKLLHHHEDTASYETQTIHKPAEKCAICKIEFSVFDLFEIGFNYSQFAKTYFKSIEVNSKVIVKGLFYFSERGPPFFT